MSDERAIGDRLHAEAEYWRNMGGHDERVELLWDAIDYIAELEAENAQLLADTAEPVCCCNVGHR